MVVDKNRVDGSRVRLAEVDVGDETGRVSLRARDEQIDLLSQQQGQAVVLRNCTLELFQGKHIRLAVTKWGKITPHGEDHVASTPVPPSRMNEERFYSLIDLTVVAKDSAVHATATEGEGGSEGGYGGGAAGAYSGGSNPSQRGGGRGGGGGGDSSERGGGNRKGGRPKTASMSQQQQLHAAPYAATGAYDAAMRYQGGLHGYGYIENMDAYGGYRVHPAAAAAGRGAPPPHVLMQQQYEMHQRQLHHSHMAAAAAGYPRHDAGAPQTPLGLSGGFPDMSFLSAAAAAPPPMPHAIGVHTGTNLFPAAERSTVNNNTTGTTTSGSPTRPAANSSFPSSPKMNPRAATFDPSSKTS